MLPVLEKVEANANHSFHVNHMKVDYFPSPLHFHPEVEILLVLRGTGTRFIGDSVKRFAPGDLIMIGSNTPHVWYSDRDLNDDTEPASEAIYIMFNPDIFGDKFWGLPESNSIARIIEYGRRGIKLKGERKKEATELMKKISQVSGFDRIKLLMEILGIFASSDDSKFISSPVFHNTINKEDSERLNKIYEYSIQNAARKIPLEEIASEANLSVQAFCRYFKNRTNKTFIHFLNEIRVGNACRLLIKEDLPVADVSFICGFNNISYFIKQFKKITGYTPYAYRKQFV